jgi:hypothetical protein
MEDQLDLACLTGVLQLRAWCRRLLRPILQDVVVAAGITWVASVATHSWQAEALFGKPTSALPVSGSFISLSRLLVRPASRGYRP